MRYVGWLVVVAVLVTGCGGSILGSDPGVDPERVFEDFWSAYDRHYAHFAVKDLDWDRVYDKHRPRVDSETTDDELFEVLGDMIAELEDGHVYLVGDDGKRAFSDREIRGSNRTFDAGLIEQYVVDVQTPTPAHQLLYGNIDESTGYIRLTTLSGGSGTGDDLTGWIEEIETAVQELSETDGIIVDLRNNGGGRAFNAKYAAGHFATERKRFLVTRSRAGPDHSDFSEPTHWYAEPSDSITYERPVVVLTNRRTFSAAEWLTLALRQYDHVVHMGTHTGGGLAMFLPRQLPNGWMHTVSVQDTRGPEGRSFERVGVRPDRYVKATSDDLGDGRDPILEEAVEFLEN